MRCPDSEVHGANMGPIWGRQDPGGPRVGPLNLAIWVVFSPLTLEYFGVGVRSVVAILIGVEPVEFSQERIIGTAQQQHHLVVLLMNACIPVVRLNDDHTTVLDELGRKPVSDEVLVSVNAAGPDPCKRGQYSRADSRFAPSQ